MPITNGSLATSSLPLQFNVNVMDLRYNDNRCLAGILSGDIFSSVDVA